MRIFKRALATVLCVVMIFGSVPLAGFVGLELPELNLFSTKAEAATSGTCGDNLTWTFDESTGELIISGTGDMDDFVTAGAPWYRLSVDSVTISEGVTSIGDCAFYELDGLENVTIPDSITSIGNNAFRSCNKLTSITIPASVTSIGEKVFYFCISLTSITVDPANTAYSSDDYGVLFNKDKTELIQYPTGNTRTDYVIPDGVSIIGNAAFDYCKKLINVTIPDGVTSIGEAAFCLCVNLESIIIPDSVTSIGFEAFAGCYNLKSIIIPNNVTSIGDDAFAQCMAMEFIHIPSSVTTVGNIILPDADKTELVENIKTDLENASEDDINYYAQMGITKESVANWLPTTVVCSDSENSAAKTFAEQNGNEFEVCNGHDGEIPDTPDNPDIPDNPDLITGECGDNLTWTFNESTGELIISGTGDMWEWSSWGTPWDSYQQSLIRTVSVGDGVTSISAKSFKYCQNLTAIELPDSVTSIGAEAFTYCHSLTSVEISDSVTSIGYQAFYGCESLASITIPDGVTSISEYAFRDTGYYNDESNWENDVLYIGKHLICANQNISGSCKIKEGTLSIADDAFRNCYNLTSVTIPESVTSISDYAFVNCTSLTSITIPESVTSISDYAFVNCTSLTSITIPDGVTSIGMNAFRDTGYYNDESNWENDVLYIGKYLIRAKETISGSCKIKEGTTVIADRAFNVCSELTSIEIPDSVTSIGEEAFTYCHSLTSVTIPESVTSIGDAAFVLCKSLTSITVDSENTAYSSDEYGDLFNKDKTELIKHPEGSTRTNYVISDGVKSIGYFAVAYCDNLTSITIPDSVTSIGGAAFAMCTGLTSIEIPENVTSIDHDAFAACTGLTSITLPDSLTSIGGNAFYHCTGLTSITLPKGLKRVNGGAFTGCTGLTELVFDCVGVYMIGEDVFEDCSAFTSVIIGDEVTKINDFVFAYLSNLESVVIGNSVTSIGMVAFYRCESLTSITIPDSVTNIGYGAFAECTNLESITIGNSVTSIDMLAFTDCDKLADVYYKGTEEEWNDIEIGSDNECLLNATIHFNSTGDEIPDTPDTPDNPDIPELITGVCGDNLTWSLDESTGELVISGTGDMWDYYVFSTPWYNNTELIKTVRVLDGVTSIGKYAFNGCSNLVSVEIPDGVTSIGDYAFDDCSELVTIEISDNVTNIGEGVFGNCTSLTSITIDENNQYYSSDEYGVLFNKNKTELIQYPAGNTRTFYSIPVGVTDVRDYAFNGCTNLESIIIPDSIVKIGEGAFFECSGLKNVEIPDSVTDIGSVAFSECSNLTSVTLSNNITDIKFATFGQCYLLENITIPESVTSIGVGVFDGCISLESITIPDGVTSIGGSAFNGCENLISVTLSDNITSIDGGIFCGCKNLVSIKIPDGVTSIGNYAFYGCVRLGNVILPDSVTCIGENAFCNCMAMDCIHIPSSVTQTGEEIILMDSHKAELIELFDNMSIEEIAKEIGLDDITREEIAGWSTSTLICSDSEDCFIKLYADEFGNQFEVCGGDHREEFTVTLNIDGVQTVITLKEGDAISVEDPVKEGHTFVEWTPAMPEIMPSENLEFTAVFEVDSYNVNWIIDGMVISETHKFGAPMDQSKSFEKKGYTFIGWTPEIPETMPACDLEFTAIFEINISDAVFNANGGMFADGDLVKRIATEQNAEILAPQAPERAGYQFAGWAYNGKNIGSDVGIMDSAEGKIFDAVWIPNEKTAYKVETYTMNTYGEYEVSSMLVNAFVSEVVSVDYTVSEGFEINEEKSVLSGTVTSEETLVLKVYIDRKQYKFTTVVFDTETTVLYYYGAVVTGPDRPYIDGYVFQYWEPSAPVIMPPHDVTVTAKFRETTPKPRIEMVTPEKRTIYYGESIILQVRTYDMPSYAKIKWEVLGDGVSIKPSASGKTCKVTSTSNGNVVVKAYVVDSYGNTIEGKDGKPIYDFEYLYSEVNLWQIIVNFFRQLFGKTDTVSQIFRVIY